MNPTPPLTLDAVRDWVGDHEIGKGRPYAEGPAVIGCVRTGDTLRAGVKGTRTRPYRVRVSLGGSGVAFAGCSCPVGYYGKCKHVAAVLLAYHDTPGRFVEVADADANLAGRDKAELVALVKTLLRHAPELEPWLARPLPGFAPAGPSEMELYFMAIDVIRAANPHDELAASEIAGGLKELIGYAGQFGGDVVFAVVRRALADEGFGGPRYDEVLRAFPADVRERLAAVRGDEQSGAEELPF